MKQFPNKFIYNEIKDQIIVENIKKDFAFRQEERKRYELAWELNMNFFVGNQYCYVSNQNEVSDIEKRYYWENREVYNHIAPIIEARLSKLKKINPVLSIKPISGSQEDFYIEKLSKLILQKALDKNSIKEAISLATYWSEITGTSFYKLSWENDSGEIIGNVDGKDIKNGDVKISVCSPFEIFPDSNGVNNIEDCNSIICARAYPVDFINEKYHKHFKGSDVDIFELGSNSFLNGMSGRSNITKVNHSKKYDHILLIEKYEKPSIKNPNGKLTIICENELLYDGEMPYIIGDNGERGYPFIKQVSSSQIGCFWGTSIIERCIPVQRAYNAIKNKKHEYIQRLASGVLTVEDGSVDIDNLENDGLAPGKILVYRNGSTPPKFLSPNSIPEELKDEEDRLIQELNILSSTSDMMVSSGVPSNINSGTALSMLIEQDNSRLSLAGENIRNAMIKIGKIILRLYKQFATNPRLYQICDSTGNIQVAYWNKNDILSDDVIIETNNELDENVSLNKSLILSLYEKGLFSDENGNVSSTNKMKILKLFGIETFEQFEDMRELHRAKATKENLEYQNLCEPLEIDDHEVHINEHTRFLISDESNQISTKDRENLLNHIKLHKNFLKNKNQNFNEN